MKQMSANQIRQMWLDFFKKRGHEIIPSASLIPHNDDTLLWINSGVASLKKYFDGTIKPSNPRIVNFQKCIRTNDIENVGQTARHHTFFEMLGNFSIGDYFKIEAVKFGFDFLTSASEGLGLATERLYITYYPTDLETRDAWIKNGISADNLIPFLGNYWEIGAGPSGPNTEIFYDRGDAFDLRGKELIEQDLENDRFIEIWNIVFSQFNAEVGELRSEYKPLPSKNIDTGAGLERIAAVMQDKQNNFETDLFFPIILEVQRLTNIKYSGQKAFKVIADHIKTLTFAINDGAILTNEGRGYVLRRILRRSMKYGRQLNLFEPFLFKLVWVVAEMMNEYYVDLTANIDLISRIILKEEYRFLETIADGERQVKQIIQAKTKILSGAEAFKLYDTYGFPIELTIEYLSEHDITVDLIGFGQELKLQQERSRDARSFLSKMSSQNSGFLEFTKESQFTGYTSLQEETTIIKVFNEGIVLDKTPFYATSGGQSHDLGTIENFQVQDVIKLPNGQHLHVLEPNDLKEGSLVLAKVDSQLRRDCEKNHTATHLLHQALKDVLGNHVSQKGSFVDSEILRFDFNHFEAISETDVLKIEQIVNQKISHGLDVETHQMALVDAKKIGAQALFGEKYQEIVRVVKVSDFSIELCGGTHVRNSADIFKFMITDISSIGSGIYRVTAITGKRIDLKEQRQLAGLLNDNLELIELLVTSSLNQPLLTGSYQDLIDQKKFNHQLKEQLKIQNRAQQLKQEQELLRDVGKYTKTLANQQIIRTSYQDLTGLKVLVDAIFEKLQLKTIVLVNIFNEAATIIVKSSNQGAVEIIKLITKATNGRGGGRQDFAQAGTEDLLNLETVLLKIEKSFK